MSGETPVLLVVCGRSCGSIDWVLPVLHVLHRSGECQVKVFFKCETICQRMQQDYQDLASILAASRVEIITKSSLLSQLGFRDKLGILLQNAIEQVSGRRPLKAIEKIVQFVEQVAKLPFSKSVVRANKLADTLAARLLTQRLANRRVEYVLHDFPADVPVFSAEFAGADIVYFPHGTLSFERLHNNSTRIQHMVEAEPLGAIPEDATWLVGNPGEEPYYRRTGLRSKVVACGHPKFDRWWAGVLNRYASDLPEQQTAQSEGPRILFLSVPARKFSDASHRKKLLADMFEVAAEQHWDLRVKLHPHEDHQEFQAIAAAAKFADFQWCHSSVSGAATQVDFVVCFPTSAAMDAIAAGAPVIEFFDFSMQKHTSFLGEGGNKTSIYRAEGLVEPANNAAELAELTRQITQDADRRQKLLSAQETKLAALAVHHGNATEQVLAVLQGPIPHQERIAA